MGELLAHNDLGEDVGTPLWPLHNSSFFAISLLLTDTFFFLPFPHSFFSNRWILQFERLGQLKAPQCLVLAATQICCADLILVRTGLRAADQCPGELLGWNTEISSTDKRKNTTNNDRKGTHQLYLHSLCCTQQKKKLVYSVHHFSNFAFNNIWLCTQSADPITWSIFSDTRWFCLHTQPSVPDQIHFCFTACRQITRGEQSRACQPHTSPNKALAMHQQLLYTDLLQRSLSPLPS